MTIDFSNLKDLFIDGKKVAELYFNGKKVKMAEQQPKDYFKLTSLAIGGSMSLLKTGTPDEFSLEYSTDDGDSWNDYAASQTIPLNEDKSVMFRRKGNATQVFSKNINNYWHFVLNGTWKASGNIMSLLDASMESTTVGAYAFANLFIDQTTLVDASELKIDAQTIGDYAYTQMFARARSLSAVRLDRIDWGGTATQNWLSGVSGSGRFLCPQALGNEWTAPRGTSYVPESWTVGNFDVDGNELSNAIINYHAFYNDEMQYQSDNRHDPSFIPAGVLRNGATGETLAQGTDFTLQYEADTTTPGVHHLSAVGMGSYSGHAELAYSVLDIQPACSKKPLTLVPTENQATIMISALDGGSQPSDGQYLQYTLNEDYYNWQDYDGTELTVNAYVPVSFRCNPDNSMTKSDLQCLQIVNTSQWDAPLSAYGNIQSLIADQASWNDFSWTANDTVDNATSAFTSCFVHAGVTEAADLWLPGTTNSPQIYAQLFKWDYDNPSWMQLKTPPRLIVAAPPTRTHSSDGQFYEMFGDCASLSTAPELPCMVVGVNEYAQMFYNCTSISSAPELPARVLAGNCYSSMFDGCSQLSTAPELPARVLAGNCYSGMFSHCGSITSISLPAAKLAYSCYQYMFAGSYNLASPPELPSLQAKEVCYRSMFSSCGRLSAAPELPARVLAGNCYSSMFGDCASLSTAPELPARVLAGNCYSSMFSGCTNLSNAPMLQVTTDAQNACNYMFSRCQDISSASVIIDNPSQRDAFSYMFSNCSSLTSLSMPELKTLSTAQTMMYMLQNCTSLTSINTKLSSWNSNATGNWLYGASNTGTFTLLDPSCVPSRDESGVPAGWTVVNT